MYKCVTSRVVIKYYDLYRFYFMCVTEEEGGGRGELVEHKAGWTSGICEIYGDFH